MHSAAACAIQPKKMPAQKFCDMWLPTQNRIQQNVGVGETQVGNLLVLRTPVEP